MKSLLPHMAFVVWHFGDFRVGDAETAAKVAAHGVEFVEFFDAVQQGEKFVLQVSS
jgi:hypothetical protein